MGVYSNSVSVSQFRVTGELPKEELFTWFSNALQGRGFRSIEQSAEETAEGWVCTDSPDEATFNKPDSCWRDRYLFFSYRRDQRRIPSALFKFHLNRAEEEYLAKRPEMKRPPKREKEEMTERIRLSLLAKSLPSPATVDLVWNVDSSVLTLFSSSSKAMERFEDLFAKSFENIRTQLVYPYRRTMSLLDESDREKLAELNQSSSEAALEEISGNRWLGEEFLLWLLHGGIDGEAFRISTAGHLETGAPFSAWVDDRIQLQGGGEAGPQKVAVSGSQDHYLEARSALRTGKTISSAIVHLQKDELQWRFSLNGELFTFSSFKCPSVKIEREGVEQISERESAFYERIYLLESGLQMFDSLLFSFLKQRLGNDWQDRLRVISKWLEE